MRTIFWPLLFLSVLWLIMVVGLPTFVQTHFVPNLILAGVIVLATTDAEARWILLVAVFGLLLDLESSLLFGSFGLGLVGMYLLVRYIFMHIVPSSRVYTAIPLVYVGANIILQVWLWLFGMFASKLGWPIWPGLSLLSHISWWILSCIGGFCTLLLYVLWLEILHRIDKPIRM